MIKSLEVELSLVLDGQRGDTPLSVALTSPTGEAALSGSRQVKVAHVFLCTATHLNEDLKRIVICFLSVFSAIVGSWKGQHAREHLASCPA